MISKQQKKMKKNNFVHELTSLQVNKLIATIMN